ncbi:MAG: ABC transporter ATP-binding protein [Acidobacteria bacterium]|nr:ABC transporter ATP-binding protein [Acidobacteriota bacterium]
MPDEAQPLLEARLSVRLGGVAVLRDVHLRLERGRCTGLVGQSGSGKSTLGLALTGLLGGHARVEGSILFEGEQLLGQRERQWQALRGRRIALVLQSASSALNPALRISTQFEEAWRAHSRQPWAGARAWVCELLRGFDLPEDDGFLRRYPAQVSVGQAQRILIAMALLHRPDLLIADEVTSALDFLTQREVVASLRRANREWGVAVLHITHDLLSVPGLCDEIVVLEKGVVVESGPSARILEEPAQEYTRRLMSALRSVRSGAGEPALGPF